MSGKGKPKVATVPTLVPVTVTVHGPLLDAVRALFPQARDWPASRLVAACIALALKTTGGPRE